MNVRVVHESSLDQDHEEAGGSLVGSLLDLLELISRHGALLAAWVATCGSLFLSEVIGWTPCVLCWYQRILMYPLTVILAVGIWRRDRGVYLYVLPLSILGVGTSLYHYLLIKTDN
jgi:disulfide bond formation protein DsbB